MLVVFSGGTISMRHNKERVLEPVRNLMKEVVSLNNMITDPSLSTGDFFVTPSSVSGQRVAFTTLEIENPIDSADATPAYWQLLA